MADCVFATSVGGPDVIKMITKEIEEPGEKDVLVDVKSCSLNFFDIYIRQGLSADATPPCVLGLECAGVVTSTGSDVTSVQVGDRVIVHCPKGGAMAAKVVVPEDQVLAFPDSIDFDDASCLTIAYLTAYFCLYDIGNLREGSKVFIQGAAGGVGWAATQICKLHPGVIVFGTASLEKHEAILENGVDYPLTYQQNLREEIWKYSPEGVDIVIENMAGKEFQRCMELLSPLGKIVLIGAKNMIGKETKNLGNVLATWWNTKNVALQTLIMKNRCVAGFNLNELQRMSPSTFKKGWQNVLQLLIDHKIKPHIDSCFTFTEASEACLRITQRKNIGKILLKPPGKDQENDQMKEQTDNQ